jgi:hypothetical protein
MYKPKINGCDKVFGLLAPKKLLNYLTEQGSNPGSTALEVSMQIITPPMRLSHTVSFAEYKNNTCN